MTDYCNECDTQVAAGVKFCPECGAKTPEQLERESIPNQAKHYVGEAADELWGATKDAYHSGKHLADKDSAKKVAGGAALGAAASIIAPVGIAAGAAIGAGIVAYRHLNKKKKQEENGE
ncbi:MAG: zinc-ribbon domain-containing protein [Sphingorhabdus sp.]